MPSGLDRTDRAILIFAAVLLVVLATATAILNPSGQHGRAGYPSSYSTKWDGAKAAYLLLEELGYKVKRWDDSPTALGENAERRVLILASPMQPPEPEEAAALRRFLEGGGRILATGETAAMVLPNAQAFVESDEAEATRFYALIPSPLTAGAKEISMAPPYEWHPKEISQIVVYGNGDTAAVVTYPVGRGRVIWWGSPSPLTNHGLKESGNLVLFLNSIGDARKEILWDEYFHGARGDLWSYVGKTPLPWAGVQLGLGLLLIFVTYSRRYGTIHMPGKISRLSPLEFVDTLGSLYRTAHAGSAAIRVAYQRFRFQLTRQLGLPGNAPPAEMAKAARQTLGWEEAPLLGSLVRADRGSRSIEVKDTEALEIVQELHDYTVRLETRRAPEEKRKPE
jgi:hypothetical protein